MKIGCDLFLDLQMFSLPDFDRRRLEAKFDLQVIEVNTPSSPDVPSDISIYWGNRITPEIISSSKSLKWIHFGSVGVDRAKDSNVEEMGILVSSSRGLVSAPMTASALGFLTSLARGFHHAARLRFERNLSRSSFDHYFREIQDLEGQTVAIVGLGDVGGRFAKVCAALGMKVVGIRKNASRHCDFVAETYTLNDLPKAISQADFVFNFLPLSSETRQVFGEEIFSLMRPSSYFVNMGRGETVDEDALIVALAERRILGAGLDVFATEPLSPSSPLWELENVLILPHVSGLSQNYWTKQVELFEENLELFLSGKQSAMRNLEK